MCGSRRKVKIQIKNKLAALNSNHYYETEPIFAYYNKNIKYRWLLLLLFLVGFLFFPDIYKLGNVQFPNV